MNDGGSPLLSVRTEARQLAAPDYAVVDGLIEHTERSKVEALQSVTGSLSSWVVAQEETLMRMAVCPCHSVPPHQQAPSF